MFYNVDDRLSVNPVETTVETTAPATEETAPVVEIKKSESFDNFRFWEIKVTTGKRYNRYFGKITDPAAEALFKASLEAEREGRLSDAKVLLNAAINEAEKLRR